MESNEGESVFLASFQVKVINDELVVHCRQEAESGRLPREIHRSYRLPSDVDGDSIKSTLRSDGTLRVTGNKRRM